MTFHVKIFCTLHITPDAALPLTEREHDDHFVHTLFLMHIMLTPHGHFLQDSNFRGWQMPVYENISDLGAINFQDISSMRVSKGWNFSWIRALYRS